MKTLALSFSSDVRLAAPKETATVKDCCVLLDSAVADFFIIGRNPRYCDVQLIEQRRSVSRLHCVIKYFPQGETWAILDGAFYSPQMQEDLGKLSQHRSGWIPSDNGVYVNGRRVTADAGNWDPLRPDDRLQIGAVKCRVAQSCDDTLQNYQTEIPQDEQAQVELGQHIAATTSQAPPQPETLWTVAAKFLDWLQRRSQSRSEALMKWAMFLVLVAAGAVVAIAIH